MAFDLWTHQFCLACDKQVQSDQAAYCSESCRLADFEKTPSSPLSSQASSPDRSPGSYSWGSAASTSLSRRPRSKFYLSPAYDFSNAQPYGATPLNNDYFSVAPTRAAPTGSIAPTSTYNLTPSSSHSSLCSIQSTSTNGEMAQLSAEARQELRAYAVSFEQVRLQRRRSY